MFTNDIETRLNTLKTRMNTLNTQYYTQNLVFLTAIYNVLVNSKDNGFGINPNDIIIKPK